MGIPVKQGGGDPFEQWAKGEQETVTESIKPSKKKSDATDNPFFQYAGVEKKNGGNELDSVAPSTLPTPTPTNPSEPPKTKEDLVNSAKEYNAQVIKKGEELRNAVNDYNIQFNTNFNPDEILSSADKSSEFAEKLKEQSLSSQRAAFDRTAAMKRGEMVSTVSPDTENVSYLTMEKAFQYADVLKNHVVNKTIEEGKKSGLSKDKIVDKIYKNTNPIEYNRQVEATMPKVVTPLSGIGEQLGEVYDNLVGTKEKQELLNSQKGEAEILYNNNLKQLANDKIAQGIELGDDKLITEGQNQLKEVDEDAIYRFPSLVKQQIAKSVSDAIAAESGQLKDTKTENKGAKIFGAATGDLFNVMVKQGWLSNPKTKDIAMSMLSQPDLFADASYLGGVQDSFMQPFKELGMSVADITGFRNKMDILSDKKKDEMFPKEVEGAKADFTILGHEFKVRNALNTTANLAGMAVIASATEGVGTGLGAGAKAAKSMGAYTSFGLPSYDGALKDSYNFLDNDASRSLYATITAITNAEGGRMLDLGKIVRIPGVSEQYAKMAKGLTDESLTKKGLQELLGETKNKYIDFAVKYGKNVTKGAAIMTYFTIANNIERLAFGDQSIKEDDLLPQAATAFMDGVLGMSIMGAFGAAAEMRNERNTTYKGFIYNMAVNHDAAADVFKKGLENGTYTPQEYNEKIQILNTARSAKQALDETQLQTSVSLDENQKSVYVANKTAQAVLEKQLENTPTENTEQQSKLKGQIENLSQQNKDVFEGLKFSPTLEPLYDLFEAEKKYNEALEEVNNGSWNYDNVEVAKNSYDQLINKYFTHQKLQEAEIKVETKTPENKEISDTEIKSTFDKVKNVIGDKTALTGWDFQKTKFYAEKDGKRIGEFDTREEAENAAFPEFIKTENTINKVNNAENINEKELEEAQDVLYKAWDNAPESRHLIEPLILKLQDYDFKTKTEISTVTEKEPIEGTTVAKSRKQVNPALEQAAGSEATITTAEGGTAKGTLNIRDGQYVLDVPGGTQRVLGEKAITDRDLKLPDEEKVAEPIEFDEDGNVKSVTFETKNGNLVTIHDAEKALDLAIQLQAEIIGEIPDAAFEKAFNEVQKEIQVEVPVKDISSQSKTDTNGSKKSTSQESSQESGEKGSSEKSSKEGNGTNVVDTTNPSDKGTASSKETVPSIDLIETLKGKIPDFEYNSYVANPELALREIADQALGFTRNGEERVPHEGGGNEEAARIKYGDAVVDAAIKKYPKEPPPKTPISETDKPKFPEKPERRFTKQVLKDEKILPKAEIEKKLEYIRQTNAMSIKEASEIIDQVGVDEAFDMVVNDPQVKPAVRVVLGQMIIKKFNNLAAETKDQETRDYYIDQTVKAADFVTERLATEPGQMIQAFSLYGQLSPEAQMRSAIKDVKAQAKERENKRKSDVNEIANKLKKANEETVEELTKSKKVEKAVEETENKRVSSAKDKIEKAKKKRDEIIKKHKEDKGKNLYASVGLTNEGIEFVGNLAKTYLDEGIANVEIIVEKIKEHLKSLSGKAINDEVDKNINDIVGHFSETVINKKTAEGFKELEKSVNSIVKEHYTVTGEQKKSLTKKFIDDLGLSKEDAELLSKEIETEFDNIATRKKTEILHQEKRRFDRIKAGLEGAKKPSSLEDDVIKYSNLGAFDNAELLDMIAEKLGTGSLKPEQIKEIEQLAKKIEKAPQGSPKNDAVQDLLTYRANMKGKTFGEVAQGVWYANILSGYLTHIKNIVSTFFNGMSFFGVEAVRNPKAIPFLLYGGAKGIKRGLVEAAHTVTTGRSPIHVSKIEVPNILERTEFVGGYLNPGNYLKFVGRLMVAEDVLQFQGLKEMRATQLAYREAFKEGNKNPFSKETWKIVNEKLLNTTERKEAAKAQIDIESAAVKEEKITGIEDSYNKHIEIQKEKEVPSKEIAALEKERDEEVKKASGLSQIEATRRRYELMEQSRPIQMQEAAYGFAAKGTFNHDTEGTLGALTNGISQALDINVGGAKPLRFLVPFTKIITNVANNTLDYSPVGLVRAARGKRGFESFEGKSYTKGAYHVMTKEERQQTIAKASLGIASMAALYALSGTGQIQITGAGPSDIKKKLQLMQEGWQPYSIKIGDTYYSYKLTPMVFAWGLVGSVRDHEQYDKDDDATLMQRIALASWDGVKSIGDMTWVSSAAPIMSALSSNNPGQAASILKNTATNTAKGFILPNAYTQARQKIEQVFNMPQKQANNLGESLIKDVPFARNALNDKINALGDPIVKDVDILASRETQDPTWKYLLDKKGWIAPVNKNTIIVYDNKIEQDRPITEDEYYEFSKMRGGKIKAGLEDIIKNGATIEIDGVYVFKTAEELTSKQLNKLLTPIKTQATKDTKEELFMQDSE